jgi:UDP-glucose 4-epimerase
MKYLITGGAGFIGSHLAESLLKQNHEVTVLDDFSTGSHDNIGPLEQHPRFQLVVGDVRDRNGVKELVKNADRVFHLASAVGVKLIIDHPIKTIENILEGASSIFSACARYRKPVLTTSTSEAYGKSSQTPFTEDQDLLIGVPNKKRWAYACSKIMDEFLAFAYWHEQRLPVINVRLFNTVGPRQTGQYGMVIPTLVRQALKQEALTVFGDGQQKRCFCHVKDVCSSLSQLIERPSAFGHLFNIGSTEETAILGLAEKIVSLTQSKSTIRFVPYEEVYGQGFDDMQRRVPDLTKIKEEIGFKPSYNLDQILTDVIGHEKKNV